jgi:hypothetical protein
LRRIREKSEVETIRHLGKEKYHRLPLDEGKGNHRWKSLKNTRAQAMHDSSYWFVSPYNLQHTPPQKLINVIFPLLMKQIAFDNAFK